MHCLRIWEKKPRCCDVCIRILHQTRRENTNLQRVECPCGILRVGVFSSALHSFCSCFEVVVSDALSLLLCSSLRYMALFYSEKRSTKSMDDALFVSLGDIRRLEGKLLNLHFFFWVFCVDRRSLLVPFFCHVPIYIHDTACLRWGVKRQSSSKKGVKAVTVRNETGLRAIYKRKMLMFVLCRLTWVCWAPWGP